jgi:hypothetical protein
MTDIYDYEKYDIEVEAISNLYERMSKDLLSENPPFPVSALRSVSIAYESRYIVRVRLEITISGWEKTKQDIIERYGGDNIQFVEVNNFRIVNR